MVLLAVVAFTAGCGLASREASPPARVYLDLTRLVALNPGASALAQLDAQIESLASLAGVEVALPTLAPPPPVPLPQASPPAGELSDPSGRTPQAGSFIAEARQAAARHLAALGQELAQARARKVASRRQELMAALNQEMKAEQARLQEPRQEQEQEVFRQYRRQLLNLQLNLGRKDLTPEQRQSLQAELQSVENQQEAELTALRQKTQQALAAVREEKTRQVVDLLARYEIELRTQDDMILTEHRSRMETELNQAAERLQTAPAAKEEMKALVIPPQPMPDRAALSRQLGAQRAGAQAVVTGSRQALLAQVEQLKGARGRLLLSMQEETRTALEQLAAPRGLHPVFDARQRRALPDYTPQAAQWLRDYWRSPAPQATPDR